MALTQLLQIAQLRNDLRVKNNEIEELKQAAATFGTTASPQQTDSFAEREAAYKQFIRFRLDLVFYFIRFSLIDEDEFKAAKYRIDKFFISSYSEFKELVKIQKKNGNFPERVSCF